MMRSTPEEQGGGKEGSGSLRSHLPVPGSSAVRHVQATHDGRPIGYVEPYVKPEKVPGAFVLAGGSMGLEKARRRAAKKAAMRGRG